MVGLIYVSALIMGSNSMPTPNKGNTAKFALNIITSFKKFLAHAPLLSSFDQPMPWLEKVGPREDAASIILGILS